MLLYSLFLRACVYSVHMTPQLRGRGMIELGAGCGLCGITAAKLCGCLPAMLTDFAAPTMANLKHNLTINGMSAEECSKALDWRDQSTWPVPQPVVIGADLIYAREAVEPLLAAVSGLVSPGGAFLYVAPETNRQGEAEFLTGLCARGWECQRSDVPPSYLTNAFVKPQPAGGGGAAGGDAAMEEEEMEGGSEEDFFALFTELKQRTYHLYCFTRIGEIGLPPLPEAQPPPQQQPSGAGAVNLSVVPTSSQSVNLSVSPAEEAMDVS